MRMCWAALAVALAASAAPAQESPLQIFTVKNELTRWRGDGLRDAQGRVVLGPAGLLTALAKGGFMAQREGAFWLYDARGARVGGPYDSLEAVDPALDALIVGVGGNPVLEGDGGLIDGSGRELMAPVYKDFRYLPGTQLFSFEQARRWGLADAQGRVVVKPTLDGISDAPDAVLVGDAGQQGLIDRTGRYVVPLGASTVSSLNDHTGVATGFFDVCDHAGAVCRGVDSAGRPIFGGRTFSGATLHRDLSRWVITDALEPAGAAASDAPAAIGVGITPRKVLADEQGRTLATFDCDYLYRVGGLFRAARAKDDTGGCLWGLVDRDGQWRVPARYDSIETVREAAGVKADAATADDYVVGINGEDGKRLYGVLAADGSQILAPQYEQVFNRYAELGLYLVQQDRKVGLIDRQGRWRMQPSYTETASNTDLHPPYLLLSDRDRDDDGDGPQRERDTIVDARTGKPVFASDYDYLDVEYDFRWEKLGLPWEEFAIVVARRDGKYGALDLQGRVIVPLKYDNLQGLDSWGRLRPTVGERDLPPLSALGPQRSSRLHEAVSRQLRAEPAPHASESMPYAGRYVPADYRDAEQVRAAVAAGRLSRAVAPMLLLDEDAAIIDLDMVADRKRPNFEFLDYYCARENGFDLPLPLAKPVEDVCEDPSAPKLEFRAGADGSWDCATCAKSGLPSRWVRTDPAAAPAMP